jgi:hypothetical protein
MKPAMSDSPSGAVSMNGESLANRSWWVAFAAILLGSLLFAFGRGSLPKAGQSTTYAITVIPLDARTLACASDTVLSGRRCGFDGKSQLVPGERPLRPYVTVGRELVLLAGVFESSSVAAWLAAAQRTGDETRVTLNCYARILGTMTEVSVRWAVDGAFQSEHSVMSADIEDCVVQH